MRISIALAAYNGQRFLQAQLDSLAQQTHLPHELVVCDDGSQDDTVALVNAFAARAPFRVTCVRNERNLGWKDNFLKAAGLCDGDWIAFCDQDDVWMANKLERLSAVAAGRAELLLLVHAAAVAYEDLELTGERLPDVSRFEVKPPLANRPWDMPAGFACCFRRSLLAQVPLTKRPHDPNWPADRLSHGKLVYMLANSWGEVAYLPDVLAIYRRHAKAVTGRGSKGRPKRGWARVLDERLRTGAEQYSRLARCAHEFSEFMTELAVVLPARTEASRRSAAYYTSLAQGLDARAALYAAPELTTRARSFASLLKSGAYANMGAPRLGIAAMTKDAAALAVSPIIGVLRRFRQAVGLADVD